MRQRGDTSRREFLWRSAAGLAGVAMTAGSSPAREDAVPEGEIPRRRFGRSGEKVSLLGVGGFHVGISRLSDEAAVALVQEAIDHGATFLDNAWEYHRGRSEERVGKAIRGRRDSVFVMTKHHGRDRKTALAHLDDSLRRLGTDRIDLWMFHECVYDEDPDRIFAPGGGIEAADIAKKAGKVRYVGFTGHKWPRIHLKMLAYGYPWDAVLMPLNILDGTFRSFEKWVLPVLRRRGIAPLAMKSRASGNILRAGLASAEECWRYVSGLPITTVVSGMDSLEVMRDNLRLARTLTPMSAEEREAIRRRTREAALGGKYEPFKTTTGFDGPVGRALYGV